MSDFVFFVSFGRKPISRVRESITNDVLGPAQPDSSRRRIRELIAHDERLSVVHLFLRTSIRSGALHSARH